MCFLWYFQEYNQTSENIFRNFFWNVTKHMKTFSFPENSISGKYLFSGNAFTRTKRSLSCEKVCEEHMTRSWRVVPGCCFRECLTGKAFPQPSRQSQNILPRGFLCVTSLPFTHTIYILITHKCKRGHSQRKTLDRFSTTHTSIF